MKYLWVRMYPNWRRPGASFVIDKLPKWEVVNDLYGEAIAEVFRHFVCDQPGYVNVEWDNAVDLQDIETIEACIDAQPGVIWVAPYWGYGPEGQHAPTNFGLGCTWLPKILYQRFEGMRSVRFPAMDGEIIRVANLHGIEVRHVPGTHVKHLHW